MLKGHERIYLLSGEGEYGTWKQHKGKVTDLAIKRAVNKEKSNGDRWVRVYIIEPNNNEYYELLASEIDLENMEIVDYREFDEIDLEN